MRKKLKDVCNFYSGTGFPVKHQGEKAGELPFYKVGDIANNATSGNVYLSTCNNYISYEVAKEIKGTVIPEDVVVFAKIGEALKLNRRAITSKKCLIDNNAMGIGAKKEYLDSHFFYFFMKNLKMESLAESTTVPSVRKTKLEEIEIDIPSFEIQKNISKILRKLENIIKDRQSQILKFDMLVKARFVEMFGTYPKNEKGWKVGKIRDLVSDVRYGSSRKAAEGNCGHYQYLRMNNITYSGELDLSEVKTIDIPKDELEKCTVKRGDLLFNRTNSKELVGKTCVYNRDEQMVLAGFIVRVRMNDKALPEFVSAFMNTDFSKQMLLGMCKTAIGQANINAQELQNIGIYIPPIKIQKEFIEFKAQIDKSKVVVPSKIKNTIFAIMLSVSFGQITSI